MDILAAALFICTPIAVWDGDGPFWCAEGAKVRIAAIAARELDGSCRPGHPCPKASGIAARDALVQLLGGAKGRLRSGHVRVTAPPMRCRAVGGSFGRVVARCRLADGRDLGQAMIATKMVERWTGDFD